MPKRAVIKKIILFCLLTLCWTGILALAKPEEVLAVFRDSENSPGNSFIAGPLDFSLTPLNDFTPQEICQEPSFREIDLYNYGNPFHYKIETTDVSGDLCSYITLTANLNGGTAECSESLVGFQCQDFIYSDITNSEPHHWQFTLMLTEGAPEESVCHFKLLFSGRQLNFTIGGFHDEEEIDNTITSGVCPPREVILLNKVYYDVDSKHGQEERNEWIELYNPNDTPVDISAWIIEDNTSQDVLPNSLVIPAYGFALITGSESTWQYWETIPSSALKIVLPDGKIGNGLANNGDRLILKDSSGRIIDEMSYEGDTTIFDPAPPLNGSGNPYDLPEGHILGREPTGYDTDTAEDWHDFGIPQVRVTYPTGGTWYCGRRYTIRWTATNPNGPNSDLAITLLYIRDLDRNGVVSSGDAVTTIAQDIANTGSYHWRVSPCYYGYIWIKVIAKGPENFMISDSALSGRVFEPPFESPGFEEEPERQGEAQLSEFEAETEEEIEIIEETQEQIVELEEQEIIEEDQGEEEELGVLDENVTNEENVTSMLDNEPDQDEQNQAKENGEGDEEDIENPEEENVTNVTVEDENATSTETSSLIDSLSQEETTDLENPELAEPLPEEDSLREDSLENSLENKEAKPEMDLAKGEPGLTESEQALTEENEPISGEKQSAEEEQLVNEQLSEEVSGKEDESKEEPVSLELQSSPELLPSQANNPSSESIYEETLEQET